MASRKKPVVGALADLTADPGLLATLTGTPAPTEEERRRAVPEEQYRAAYAVGKDLHEQVRAIAAAVNVSPSDVVRYALRVLVEDHERQGPLTQRMLELRYQPPSRQRLP